MAGRWIVEVRDERGEWWPMDGEYTVPSPADGGTEKRVLAEERESAARAGVAYTREMRAEWIEGEERS